MSKVCVVGSLTGIFTHSYIKSFLNIGVNVVIINTSKKKHYDLYLNCVVLNINKISEGPLKGSNKAAIKKNFLFCYLY